MLTCWICRGARVSSASALCAPLLRASPLVLNVAVADLAALEVAVTAHDLVISLVPYTHHAARRAGRDHGQD
ncbi:hypothetical protein B0H14DRAFT_3731797 [Mycena olivaceomarginata]|nr:hypothetical protein B0H14DRAFT_3731797 [Mycena olivaceomarginata]